MLYHLIKKWRGKEQVMMTDELPKVNDRMKTLKAGYRKGIKGMKVEFILRPAEEGADKFYQERLYRNGREH